jgi:hypothetical protein
MRTRSVLRGIILSALVCVLHPLALTAQSVDRAVAGVQRSAPSRSAPVLLVAEQEPESGMGVSILVGALFGGAIGAAVGAASADCDGFMSNVCRGSGALQGALIGAVAGALVGIFVGQGRSAMHPHTGVTP